MLVITPNKKPEVTLFDGTSNELYLYAFNTFYKQLVYFCTAILDNSVEAEDVAVETYVKLWKLMSLNDKCKSAHNAKAFLFVTAKNKCLNLVRHFKVKQRTNREIIYMSKDWEEPLVIKSLIKSEIIGRISQVMDTFPPCRKRIFIMAYIDGSSNAEIADLLNISISTVKTQKARCTLALRQSIKKEF